MSDILKGDLVVVIANAQRSLMRQMDGLKRISIELDLLPDDVNLKLDDSVLGRVEQSFNDARKMCDTVGDYVTTLEDALYSKERAIASEIYKRQMRQYGPSLRRVDGGAA